MTGEACWTPYGHDDFRSLMSNPPGYFMIIIREEEPRNVLSAFVKTLI